MSYIIFIVQSMPFEGKVNEEIQGRMGKYICERKLVGILENLPVKCGSISVYSFFHMGLYY